AARDGARRRARARAAHDRRGGVRRRAAPDAAVRPRGARRRERCHRPVHRARGGLHHPRPARLARHDHRRRPSHPGARMTVDPVSVEVIRNAFNSIARQMNNNLARSAYTPIIYEMKDCSVGVFDADARLLGQSPGLPMFLGNLETGIVATTEELGGPDGYRPGDVFMVNDPYVVASHTNDVVVFSPTFHGGAPIRFGPTTP